MGNWKMEVIHWYWTMWHLYNGTYNETIAINLIMLCTIIIHLLYSTQHVYLFTFDIYILTNKIRNLLENTQLIDSFFMEITNCIAFY